MTKETKIINNGNHPITVSSTSLPLFNGTPLTVNSCGSLVISHNSRPISDFSVPLDFNKIKTFEDLKNVLKLLPIELELLNCEEAYKYASNEWIRENAAIASELGKVLNKGEE